MNNAFRTTNPIALMTALVDNAYENPVGVVALVALFPVLVALFPVLVMVALFRGDI